MLIRRVAPLFIVPAVIAVVIAGLYASGSPKTARLIKMDTQRVNDLQNISYAINNYYQLNKKLPASLVEPQTIKYSPYPMVDPATGAAYEYFIDSENIYRLCATFSLESGSSEQYRSTMPIRPYEGHWWAHPSGRHCFEVSAVPEMSNPTILNP